MCLAAAAASMDGMTRRPSPDRTTPSADGPVTRATRVAVQRALLFPLLDAVCQVDLAAPPQPLAPPLIVVANHGSDLDCPLLLRALRPALRGEVAVAAAADRFYGGRLRGGALHVGLGTIPFDRGRHAGQSLDRCALLLRSGTSVVLFPEGTRSRDGSANRFRTGAARLALATGTPLLPAGIRGAHAVLPPGRRVPRPRPTAVRFGAVIRPLPGEDAVELTRRLEVAVRELCDGPVATRAA